MTLDPEDYYIENGLVVFTERYHLKRGFCCGSGCRHCPYDRIAVENRYREQSPGAPETPLEGGDVTAGVVRVGDTVRRPLNAQSPAIHRYLAHLERRGFVESPRFLGIDRRGREVLTYIEGEMGGRPLHGWAADENVLVAIARLQRRIHECSSDFTLPRGIVWAKPLEIGGVPPSYVVAELVGHNDWTPENIIFVDREPVGLIDFDLAGPTTRLLDVVNAIMWWAPLRDPTDRDPLLRDVDAARRMRLYANAYGLGVEDRALLIGTAERRYLRSWHVMKYRAQHDGGGWARMWDEGAGDVIRRSIAWLDRERTALGAQLR
jgi:hypothetical protein